MKGRMVVRLDPNDPQRNEQLTDLNERAPALLDRRFGEKNWSHSTGIIDDLVEVWHRLMHPAGLHWNMWIEELDLRDGGQTLRSHGLVCLLCEEVRRT